MHRVVVSTDQNNISQTTACNIRKNNNPQTRFRPKWVKSDLCELHGFWKTLFPRFQEHYPGKNLPHDSKFSLEKVPGSLSSTRHQPDFSRNFRRSGNANHADSQQSLVKPQLLPILLESCESISHSSLDGSPGQRSANQI